MNSTSVENTQVTVVYKERFQRVNALANLNQAKSYLEIGVNKGKTFSHVKIAKKVAVDPVFLCDTKVDNPNIHFHEVTSDYFFANIAKSYEPFDVIYLDGLHTFEQTFRDFCASLSFAHRNTIWLIDDTVPTGLAASMKDLDRSRKIRSLTGDTSKNWMGDVFKVVFAIHDFFPQMSYATFSGHGQTAVWFEPRLNFEPIFNSLVTISHFSYEDFLDYKMYMNQIDDAEKIFETIKKKMI
jgi:predicted O-methyltransferase YrrM